MADVTRDLNLNTVTLTLTEEEARALTVLTECVGGSLERTSRKEIDNIYEALIQYFNPRLDIYSQENPILKVEPRANTIHFTRKLKASDFRGYN